MNTELQPVKLPALERQPGKLTHSRNREMMVLGALLTAAFSGILYSLVHLNFHSELHSHLVLIPFVSWCIWRFIDRDEISPANGGLRSARPFSRSVMGAAIATFFGVASLVVYFLLRAQRSLPVTEWLWAGVLAYLFFLFAAALWAVGWNELNRHKFALLFLLFAVPLPLAVMDGLSQLLQRGSAEVADWTLRLSGLPVLRDGLVFRLPNMSVRVAEECSGVRSTLVLFIISLLAGKIFLRAPWKCVALALATIPLGLLRNALRITMLSWLSVNVDRNIINGPLHEYSGIYFFPLSLVPLFALGWWFWKSESAAPAIEK